MTTANDQIERDPQIRFHTEGTLRAVTRWVSGHEQGLAEWLKNTRRAYQGDRANVAEEYRLALLLTKDAFLGEPARIGLLDVGGADLEDVEAWSEWQNPDASGRGSGVSEEVTQGNGGKAYMYAMFRGTARIYGIKNGRRNCKGFTGPEDSEERGHTGFMPTRLAAQDASAAKIERELERILEPYGVAPADLPPDLHDAIRRRGAFTLVEGIDPVLTTDGRISIEDLVFKVARHEQSFLPLQQLKLYAMHNGQYAPNGNPVRLEPIEPYPGLEDPLVVALPDPMQTADDAEISTTDNGRRAPGTLTLFTSSQNMKNAHKNLRPRWKVVYRASQHPVGAKHMEEFAQGVPGAEFIYAFVELPALDPTYVDHGRQRPKAGPLVEAVDNFVAAQIRLLARTISDLRQQVLDDGTLDQVHEENKYLDRLKNEFLPSAMSDQPGPWDGGDGGDGTPGRTRTTGQAAGEAVSVLLTFPEGGFRIGRGVSVRLGSLAGVRVVDGDEKTVKGVRYSWRASDEHVAQVQEGSDVLLARNKGATEVIVTAHVGRARIDSQPIPIEVWSVDHVLVTPRDVEVKVAKRQSLVAEVTNDEGQRAVDVLLDWRHDADDQLIVLVSHRGTVTANRPGLTTVTAGAGDPEVGGVWARIGARVKVIPNLDLHGDGQGAPRLLVTGRDVDPHTGEVRQGNVDAAVLWQEPSDYVHGIWWLNLQNPEAALMFSLHDDNPVVWRAFHAQALVDMLIQVWMQEQFTSLGADERPDLWGQHKLEMDDVEVTIGAEIWRKLTPFVLRGEEM